MSQTARVAGAIAFAAVLILPVAVSLLRHPPNDVVVALAPEREGWAAIPLEFPVAETDGGEFVRRVRLRLEDSSWWLRYPEIRILMATYETRPALLGAELRVRGTACGYLASPEQGLRNNKTLTFTRQPCAPDQEGSEPAAVGRELELVVRTRSAGRVAFWTLSVPDERPGGTLLLVAAPPGFALTSRLALRGVLVDNLPEPGPSRLELLAYMWQLSAGTAWLWGAIATALGLLAIGAVLVPLASISAPTPATAFKSAAGAFCFATALAILYAMLVPPLQGPDEPDHLLSFAQSAQMTSLRAEAADWAKRTHFERIKFHPDERFHQVHMGQPYPVAWGEHVFPEDVQLRSPTTAALWALLGPVLRTSSAPATLLSIRLTNALIFGLAVGIGTGLLAAITTVPYPQLACFVFLFVPTLPFFGMHVSEAALLTSAYVLMSCAILVLFIGTTRVVIPGVAMGLAASLSLAGGRSAVPLAGLLVMTLAGRAILGSRQNADRQPGQLREALSFWIACAVGLAPLCVLGNGHYVTRLDSSMTGSLSPLAPAFDVVVAHPFVFTLVAVLAASVLETGVSRLRMRVGRLAAWADRVAAALAYGLAALVASVTLASLAVAYPMLGLFDPRHPPPMVTYVREVCLVLATSFRIGGPDQLLVTSFWTGFGWIDTIPPTVLVSSLVLATTGSLVVLLVHLARTCATRRFAFLLFLLIGGATSLVAYAASSQALLRDLHGRYLIGLYLVALAVAWSPLLLIGGGRSGGAPARVDEPSARVPVALLACVILHAYCLNFILSRYF